MDKPTDIVAATGSAYNIRHITGSCPECEAEIGEAIALKTRITKVSGTARWYTVLIICDRGHEWIAGHDFRKPYRE